MMHLMIALGSTVKSSDTHFDDIRAPQSSTHAILTQNLIFSNGQC